MRPVQPMELLRRVNPIRETRAVQSASLFTILFTYTASLLKNPHIIARSVLLCRVATSIHRMQRTK